MSQAADPTEAQARARDCAQRAIQLARMQRFDEAEQAMAEGAAAAAMGVQAGPAFVELALARATLMYFGNAPQASIGVRSGAAWGPAAPPRWPGASKRGAVWCPANSVLACPIC